MSGHVVVQTVGDVREGAREYARKQIAGFGESLSGTLRSARVKLTVFGRPSVRLPALAQANLEVDGQLVRAQVAAAFFHITTADDPWGYGNSPEWATTTPPPRHNFKELPHIRSERPAFELHYPHMVERMRAEAHAGHKAERSE